MPNKRPKGCIQKSEIWNLAIKDSTLLVGYFSCINPQQLSCCAWKMRAMLLGDSTRATRTETLRLSTISNSPLLVFSSSCPLIERGGAVLKFWNICRKYLKNFVKKCSRSLFETQVSNLKCSKNRTKINHCLLVVSTW